MTVFNVEQEEHASRIARKEIGGRLENIPLKILSVEVLSDDDDDADEEDPGDDASDGSDESATDESDGEDGDDDLIPEFEDLVDDN
jgi:hypothetical protein